MRVLRMALGILVAVQGIMAGDFLFAVLGGSLALMPLLNIGCCGTASCAVRTPADKKGEPFVTYEVVE